MVHYLELYTGEVVDKIGNEIGVFEIAQDKEVYYDAEGNKTLSLPFDFVPVNGSSYEEICEGRKQ